MWLEYLAKHRNPTTGVPLTYVLREQSDVPDEARGKTYDTIDDDLIATTKHEGDQYKADRHRVYELYYPIIFDGPAWTFAKFLVQAKTVVNGDQAKLESFEAYQQYFLTVHSAAKNETNNNSRKIAAAVATNTNKGKGKGEGRNQKKNKKKKDRIDAGHYEADENKSKLSEQQRRRNASLPRSLLLTTLPTHHQRSPKRLMGVLMTMQSRRLRPMFQL